MLKLLQVVSSALLVLSAPLGPRRRAGTGLHVHRQATRMGCLSGLHPEGMRNCRPARRPGESECRHFLQGAGELHHPSHWHTSAERMVLVSGELHVTYEGQPTTVLKSGMYAYGPAKLAHKAVCGNAAPCVLFIAFDAPVDAIAHSTQ